MGEALHLLCISQKGRHLWSHPRPLPHAGEEKINRKGSWGTPPNPPQVTQSPAPPLLVGGEGLENGGGDFAEGYGFFGVGGGFEEGMAGVYPFTDVDVHGDATQQG